METTAVGMRRCPRNGLDAEALAFDLRHYGLRGGTTAVDAAHAAEVVVRCCCMEARGFL